MAKYIFIIEDDPLLLKAYKLKFTKRGIDIRTATDGKEALEFLAKEPEKPAAILLDLMLPQISGFEVLESLKTMPGWKKMPIVVLSNLSQEADFEKAKALGVREYLVKADVKIDDVVEKMLGYLT